MTFPALILSLSLASCPLPYAANLATSPVTDITATVSGIGPVTATRIVDAQVSSWAEVDAVKGIGPVKLASAKSVAIVCVTDSQCAGEDARLRPWCEGE